MKNSMLGEIKPYTINGKIILPLDVRWKNYFESEPVFQVVLNKNRIVLVGPKITQDPTTDKPTPTKMEASNIGK